MAAGGKRVGTREGFMEIGKKQCLYMQRRAEQGVYLGSKDGQESVLLPKAQVPAALKEGDPIEVFVYRDSEDRPIATTARPAAEVGQFAYLPVKSIARIGAFLDWGLEKDLFLPFAEQERVLKAGEKVLVYVQLDKSGRIAASMKVYDKLSSETYGKFGKDDPFTGYVYRVNPEVGAFVAVRENNTVSQIAKGSKDSIASNAQGMGKAAAGSKAAAENEVAAASKAQAADKPTGTLNALYYGLIPASQLFQKLKAGDEVSGRILRVRKDGKLDLEIRQRAYREIEGDSEKILKKIKEYDGVLPFSENAAPETIRRELEMSKAAFKRALGHLLKEGKIEIGEQEIRLN